MDGIERAGRSDIEVDPVAAWDGTDARVAHQWRIVSINATLRHVDPTVEAWECDCNAV